MSIWTPKNYNCDHSLCLSSLDRASDRIWRYGTGYFANIYIRIIRAYFHMKQKNYAILDIKQLPYNPKSKNFEAMGILKKFFSPKTVTKNTPPCLRQIFTFRPLTEQTGNKFP